MKVLVTFTRITTLEKIVEVSSLEEGERWAEEHVGLTDEEGDSAEVSYEVEAQCEQEVSI